LQHRMTAWTMEWLMERDSVRGIAHFVEHELNPTVGRLDMCTTRLQFAASVCVAGVYCWEISLGLADSGNLIFCLFY